MRTAAMPRRAGRWLVRLLAAIGVLWVGLALSIEVLGTLPSERDADAILVLGAAQYNGRPSPVFRARLDHALDLYQRGLAPKLVFTGGIGTGDTLSEGEVGRRYALDHGVPETAILVESEGRTSAESVRAAAALMRDHRLRRTLVVSDPFHMLRLELLARQAGLQPYRAPVPESPISQARGQHWRYVVRETVVVPATVLGRDR